MSKAALQELFRRSPTLSILARELIVEGVPWIFGGDEALYALWRSEAAAAAGVGADAVYLVGSAAVGYSLSPHKAGRPFKPVLSGERYPSDIDIAIVDPTLFESAWNAIVHSDRRRTLGQLISDLGHRGSLTDAMSKVRLDIYHGAVTDSHTAPGSETGARIRALFAATTRRSPFRGHRTGARLYRRRDDLLAYHEQSLRQLLKSMQTSMPIT
jgi:hypothetical protein